MAEPAGEKINLLELITQFDSAKGHFVNSQREVLLGFREISRILVELSQTSQISIGGDFPVYVIKAVGAVIDYFLARIPEDGKPGDILTAKIQAIDELIEVLDEEGRRIGMEAKEELDLAKVEAITAIKKYLNSERNLAKKQQENPDESKRIRKVEIE